MSIDNGPRFDPDDLPDDDDLKAAVLGQAKVIVDRLGAIYAPDFGVGEQVKVVWAYRPQTGEVDAAVLADGLAFAIIDGDLVVQRDYLGQRWRTTLNAEGELGQWEATSVQAGNN